MYIGNFEITKQLISVALMILFTMAAMFFIGYKFAYDKAIRYANEQIEDIKEDLEVRYNIMRNPDLVLGNIPPLDFGGQDEK